MNPDTIIHVCNAPVVPRPDEAQDLLVLNTPMLSHWITEDTVAALEALMCEDVNAENGTFDQYLPVDLAVLFTSDHDGEARAATLRRTTAANVLDSLINDVFMGYTITGNIAMCTLHPALTQLTVEVAGQRKTLLATATSIAASEDNDDVSASIRLLAALDVFGSAHPDHLPAAQAQPTSDLSPDELCELNDSLTQRLADEGWNAHTEEEYDALNELTHEVGEHEATIRQAVSDFLEKHN